MSKKNFSYSEYSQILKTFKFSFHKFKKKMPSKFVILRHDVEFSIDRALHLAKLESKHKVCSTFFFQVSSKAYNLFSIESKNKINDIKNLGHDIGLHLYVSHLTKKNKTSINHELKKQKILFEKGLSMKCNVFSYHRPPNWVLEIRDNEIEGIINAYGERYFEFNATPKKIKYIADSQHMWKYGYPNNFKNFSKIQMLLHPDEWSLNGSINEKGFFSELIKENNLSFIDTLNSETKHFGRSKKFFK